jgi:hypothetical protein
VVTKPKKIVMILYIRVQRLLGYADLQMATTIPASLGLRNG